MLGYRVNSLLNYNNICLFYLRKSHDRKLRVSLSANHRGIAANTIAARDPSNYIFYCSVNNCSVEIIEVRSPSEPKVSVFLTAVVV